MGLSTLGTHRLPVQTSGDLGALAQAPCGRRRGPWRGLDGTARKPAPHASGAPELEEPPLQKVGHGQGHPLGRGGRRVGSSPCAIGEGDAVTVMRHQAGVLDRTAPQVAPCRKPSPHQRHGDNALDPHAASSASGGPSVQEVEPLLRAHRRGRANAPRAKVCRMAATIAPKHGHDHRAGNKNRCGRLPKSPLGFAHPRDEAVHVRVQDQRLTPGVQRREDARLCPKILGSPPARYSGCRGPPATRPKTNT